MSDDQNDKSGGWFGNPLPIVMVMLLAGGLLVKNIPLESARPTDPERVKFVPTSQQDVEARLWQDPFAAVEKHKKSSEQAVTLPKNTLMMLFAPTNPNTSSPSHRLEELKKKIKPLNNVTVVGVSVFGGSYAEDAEIRRRSRFAVVSALGFHEYHPENEDAIGYFRIDPSKRKSNASEATMPYDDDVPYEWFEKDNKSRFVLVLWLKDEKLTATPLTTLRDLFNELTPPRPYNGNPHNYGSYNKVNVKLIGPTGSGTLRALVRESQDLKQKLLPLLDDIEVYSPSATISNCDLLNQEDRQPQLDCFKNPPSLLERTTLPIVRTTGTDDVLAASLLWELWQRGVNRNQAPAHQCEDGLVLIGERDTQYGRTLLRYLNDGFSERCSASLDGNHVTLPLDKPTPVRTFSYLRGLDGVLPDIDKSGGKAPPKNENGKSKDLREQLDDAPPEHAEGRSQFDYLRRLADAIERLDRDKKSFAENGVKAIGIVGSDLYDKLIILQALRSRFKDKIFFTTDLDARYLHADQNDWARNLVVASNFGLSLRPALQHSTLPFRDSYQTSTYLATLMALKGSPFDWTKKMKDWLRPQIFEIGRTKAVHLASPSADDLTKWIDRKSFDGNAPSAENKECGVDVTGAVDWTQCANIEPDRITWSLLREHPWAISFMVCFGLLLLTLTSRCVHQTVRAAFDASSPERDTAETILYPVFDAAVVVLFILAIVRNLIYDSFARGVGEPFLWFEGISVWPSLVIRSVGLLTMIGLWYAFVKMIQQKEQPYKDFEIALPKPRKLNRSKLSAWSNGPHLNLALFDKESTAEAGSAVKEETTGKNIIDVTTLWQNYLRASSWREMAGWIVVSLLIGSVLAFLAFKVLGRPSFSHRGELVWWLHKVLVFLNALVLWTVIFWVGYETRVCVRFIETLSGVRNKWPDQLLDDTAKKPAYFVRILMTISTSK